MKKINARECEIKEVNLSIYKQFLNKNHRQGFVNANIVYGLYYKNILIQLMSFGRPRFNKNYQWELIRECTKKNYSVRGGTSKLWKHFLKNHPCHSCICYSYPQNKKSTTHYTKYCDFSNIKKAKKAKKIYFEGKWNGELKRIDKSILEHHGVDRLLKTRQGQDRTNEQILLDLGFIKKEEYGLNPQVDIYYPFHVLYRVDDLTDKSFYIGMCEVEEKWNTENYLGSGTHWCNHINKYPNHKYKRTILKNNFITPKELRDAELTEIKKYCIKVDGSKILKAQPGLKNLHLRTQGSTYMPNICSECGGKSGNHKKDCSQYIPHAVDPSTICKECGGSYGSHKKDCSKAKKCPECGYLLQSHRHSKTCSHYKQPKEILFSCPECGGKGNRHKKTCSQYKFNFVCNECGSSGGKHKKTCSKYTQPSPCPECGTIKGHLKTCSKYKTQKACTECGGKDGKHYKTCSKYNAPKPCPECGGKFGKHKRFCSQAKRCPECGYLIQSARHAPDCSRKKA